MYCFTEANVKITETLYHKIIIWLCFYGCVNLEVVKYFHENGINFSNFYILITNGIVSLEILKYLFSIGLSVSNVITFSNRHMDLQMIKYLVRTHGVILNRDNFLKLTLYYNLTIFNTSNMDLKAVKYFVRHGLDMKDPDVIFHIYFRYSDDNKIKLYKYIKKNGVTSEMCHLINEYKTTETLLRHVYFTEPIIVNINHSKDIIVT